MNKNEMVVGMLPDRRWLVCSRAGDDHPLLLPSTVTEEAAAAICRATLDVRRLRQEKGRLDLDGGFSPMKVEDGKSLARLPDGQWVAYHEDMMKPFLALPARMGLSSALFLVRETVVAPAFLLLEIPSQDNLDEPVAAAVPWSSLGAALRRTVQMLEVKEQTGCFSMTWLDYDVIWLNKTPDLDPDDEDFFCCEGWVVCRGYLPQDAQCDVKSPEFVTTGDLICWQALWGGRLYSTRAPWLGGVRVLEG